MANFQEDLLLKITGDSSGGVAAINDTKAALAELKEQADPAGIISLGSAIDDLKGKTAGMFTTPSGKVISEEMHQAALEALGLASATTTATDAMASAAPAVTDLAFGFTEGALAIALMVPELISISREAIIVGSTLSDMADATQLSVPTLSNLKFAAEATGNSLSDVNGLILNFENRMENSAPKVEAGLKMIGLSLRDVQELSRDDQILAISTAFRNAGEDVNKTAAAVDIFGKNGKEHLSLLMEPLEQLVVKSRDLGNTWTNEEATAADQFTTKLGALRGETSRAWEELGRAVPISEMWDYSWQRMKLAVANVGLEIKDLVTGFGYFGATWRALIGDQTGGGLPTPPGAPTPITAGTVPPITMSSNDEQRAITESNKSLKEQETARKAAEKATEEYARAYHDLISAGDSWDDLVNRLGADDVELIKYYTEHGKSVADISLVYGYAKGDIEQVKTVLKEEEQAWNATTKAIKANEDTTISAMNAIGKSLTSGGQRNVLMDLAVASFSPGDFMGPLLENDPRLEGQGAQLGGAHPIKGMQAITGLAPDLSRQGHSLTQAMATPLTAGFEHLFAADVPNAILAAVEGGGSPFQAVGSVIGKQLGENVGKDLAGHLASKGFEGFLGDSLKSILPGVGALIGPLLDKLFRIGGPSKEELEGRKVEGAFQSQFASFDDMMRKIGDAYIAEGLGAQKAEADVKRLLDAEKQGGDAAKKVLTEINGVLNDQAKDAADTDAAIKKYNFTLAELGPTLQRQKLGEQAAAIERDFTLLTKAGIDVTVVEAHMGTAINEFVNQARAAGGEIPIEMKPVIQSMIDQGKLLDENGHKFTSLDATGLTFSETMTQGFDKIVKKFDELLRGLGLLPALAAKAAANVPKNPFSDWIVPGVTPPVYGVGGPEVPAGDEVPIAHSGAMVWAGGLQHLHEGGFPKLWGMKEDEVFAILKQGEAIMQPSAVQSLGPEVMRAVNTGSAAAVMSATLPRLPRPTGPKSQAGANDAGPGNVTLQVVVQADRRELAKGTLDSVFLGEHRAYFNELVRQAKR